VFYDHDIEFVELTFDFPGISELCRDR